MTDHDLEFQQELRAWLRSEVAVDLTAPASLRMAMAAIPATYPTPAAERRWVLLAVALAATVVMATAVAVGSGLIRLPEPPPLPRPDVIPLGGPCAPGLADDLLLSASGDGPTGSIKVQRDGLVLRRAGGEWTQRRLTDSGVEELMAVATAPGLDGCRHIPAQGVPRDLRFEVRDGSAVNAFDAYDGGYAMEDDPAIMAAMAALWARLRSSDLQLRADQWADPEWTEYVEEPFIPNRYIVMALLWSDTEPTSSSAPPDELWDRTLPDGSTLRTLGRAITGPTARGYQAFRCTEMGPDEVRVLREHMETILGQPVEPFADELGEEFSVAFDGGGSLQAAQADRPLRTCADLQAESDSDGPQSPHPDLMRIDVCGLLVGAPLPDGKTIPPNGSASVSQDLNSCELGQWGAGEWRISLRIWPTSATEARELVQLAFGEDDFREIEMGEATAYRNCDACNPAIAVSAAPYFLLIEGGSYSQDASEELLRALAETAIERLPD